MREPVSIILDRFNAVFNRNDLDGVMAYFAEDAVYEPGDGKRHAGRAAIRRAFEPQFAGVYGAMRFDVEDQVIDEAGGKAAIRWVCRHDLSGDKARNMALLERLYLKARFGSRLGWCGLDVFHLNDAGQIVGKFTYANYDRPQLRRDLGASP
jgi:uncharacterized protein (TIGR02246 family)